MKPNFNKKDRARRGQRESKKKGVYLIDSWSALQEYITHKPQAVLRIDANAKMAGVVARYLEESGIGAGLMHVDERSETLLAEVKLTALSDAQFFDKISRQAADRILVLDKVTDPRNLGAIARTAAFFGIPYILVGSANQVHLSQAAVHTSMGGFALTDLVVTNLASALRKLKELDYVVWGAEMNGSDIKQMERPQRNLALILGAEDQGISSGLSTLCEKIVSIKGNFQAVGSLNVSAAAAIFAHYISP